MNDTKCLILSDFFAENRNIGFSCQLQRKIVQMTIAGFGVDNVVTVYAVVCILEVESLYLGRVVTLICDFATLFIVAC